MGLTLIKCIYANNMRGIKANIEMIIYCRILILHDFIVCARHQAVLNVYKIISMLAHTFDGFDNTKRSVITIFGMINNFDGLINSKHSNVGWGYVHKLRRIAKISSSFASIRLFCVCSVSRTTSSIAVYSG